MPAFMQRKDRCERKKFRAFEPAHEFALLHEFI